MLAECAHVIIPDASELAMRYYKSGNILWILGQAWALIVPLLFLFTGFTGKLEKFSKAIGKNWFFTLVVYLVLFLGIFQLLSFPLDFYTDYLRQHSYGLSNQPLSRWFDNYGKSFLVTLITAIAFLWIFYLLLKKSPRRWWLYGSLVSMALSFFMIFIQPLWIDPLFNDFGPMKNKELEQQILSLADKAGIENGRVFEVDKSKDTKMVNAYVTGLGASNRIVLWDTTLQRLQPDQILFIMGHEMGHYVLHHIWWGFLYFSALSFFLFYATYRLASFLLHRYHRRFGFNDLSHIASLPLLLFIFSLLNLLTTPLTNAFSRYEEHEADRFGLEITQNNEAAGTAFLALQQENLANPRPGSIFRFWRSTHPPIGERVDFTNSYCPWAEGKPLKYGPLFKTQPAQPQ
ncbi:MAG: M48 family metallopeptidase [Verrucomicrobiota bacterium]|nr:M48 family metallopeptidase [Verrucomicrobiota bacterium]